MASAERERITGV